MKERTLIAVLLAVILIATAITFFAKPTKNEYPTYITISKVNVKLNKVNISSVSLQFITTLHTTGPARNLSLVAEIYDARTGVLLKEVKKNFSGRNYITLTFNATFSRFKDYVVKFHVPKHPEAVYALKLVNLSELKPESLRINVELKSVDFRILNVSDGNAVVLAEYYLQPYSVYRNVSFHVKAIQYESNVLADETWIKNVTLTTKTEIVKAKLRIPKDYNYVIVLELWKNGTLVRSWKKALNLAPEKPIPKNVTEKKVNFSINKFVKPLPQPVPRPTYYTKKTPGFEVVVCLIAIALTVLRKWLN